MSPKKLRSIETTPNPNCMKLNLDGELCARPVTLTRGAQESAEAAALPPWVRGLLEVEGVRGLFVVRDFVTLTRDSGRAWQPILREATERLGISPQAGPASGLVEGPGLAAAQADAEAPVTRAPEGDAAAPLGQVEVAVQSFRGLPIQVRVEGGGEQTRQALPERFKAALTRALDASGADYLAERRWTPQAPRVGQPDEVARMMVEELVSRFDEATLEAQVQAAIEGAQEAQGVDAGGARAAAPERAALLADLTHDDWRRRLQAIQAIEVDDETLPHVLAALEDARGAVRRWAASTLGNSGRVEAVAGLARRLADDPSVSVRRAAGDALSDLGEPGAVTAACQALGDRSPLVRWRAARYLNEVADVAALPALRAAAGDEEALEVRMEMLAAIERIEGGGEALAPMWMRIARGER